MPDEPAVAQPDAGLVAWDDPSFVPETRQYDSDPIRFLQLHKQWPQNPFQDRKFQLGGVERVALLEETPYHCWTHRFNQKYYGSAVNGVRRCSFNERGHCVCCAHYEQAPEEVKDGRKQKKARCRPRTQTFGINVLVYKTDLEGNLIDEQNRPITLDNERGPLLQDGSPAELVYEVFLWRFSSDKFADVRQLKKDWGSLLNQDFSCVLSPQKDERFQDFAINIMPASAWRTLKAHDPEKAKEVVQYYKDNRYNVEAILGKLYSDEEMLGFLGTGQPSGVSPQQQAAQQPVEDIAASIEANIAAIDAGGAVPTPQPPTPPPTPSPSPPTTPTPQPTPPPPPPNPATPPASKEAVAAAVDGNFEELLNETP